MKESSKWLEMWPTIWSQLWVFMGAKRQTLETERINQSILPIIQCKVFVFDHLWASNKALQPGCIHKRGANGLEFNRISGSNEEIFD